MKLGSFFTEKKRDKKMKIEKKMKRQLPKWEEIFANSLFDKMLISKIYK